MSRSFILLVIALLVAASTAMATPVLDLHSVPAVPHTLHQRQVAGTYTLRSRFMGGALGYNVARCPLVTFDGANFFGFTVQGGALGNTNYGILAQGPGVLFKTSTSLTNGTAVGNMTVPYTPMGSALGSGTIVMGGSAQRVVGTSLTGRSTSQVSQSFDS